MPIPQPSTRSLDLKSDEARSALAKMIMKLFHLWSLSSADQLDLLGLSPKSRAMLSRYRAGAPLPDNRDSMDRASYLLSIHKALGLLYPYNEDIRYSWVTRRNQLFDNYTPLEIMKEQGMIGLSRVSRALDFMRGA